MLLLWLPMCCTGSIPPSPAASEQHFQKTEDQGPAKARQGQCTLGRWENSGKSWRSFVAVCACQPHRSRCSVKRWLNTPPRVCLRLTGGAVWKQIPSANVSSSPWNFTWREQSLKIFKFQSPFFNMIFSHAYESVCSQVRRGPCSLLVFGNILLSLNICIFLWGQVPTCRSIAMKPLEGLSPHI